ncbi:sulfate transporter isoform X1 [Octopus sinensis]|uniref:Sulfate transporter isoform X1 n=2 Tax=Octopus sinensis TaxID=2607531 RepID=A0A7E6ESM6_9MOLL|nr:sulfate transporter isoform X1 [Octopus sinensis]
MGKSLFKNGKLKQNNGVVLTDIYTISDKLPPQDQTGLKNNEKMEANKTKMENDKEKQNLILQSVGDNDAQVVIHRPVYSQAKFDIGFEGSKRPNPTLKETIKQQVKSCKCSNACFTKFIIQLFPFLTIMKGYSLRHDLFSDIVAGLTVGIMHVPQGMAYGLLTQLPPIHGLYVSFFPVLIYFFFGSSRHVSIGTFAVVCLMVGAAVDKNYSKLASAEGITTRAANLTPSTSSITEYTTDAYTQTVSGNNSVTQSIIEEETDVTDPVKLGIAMAVTFLVGCIQFLMGVLHLGFVTTFLSDPLVSGFTTGAACHVFTSQVKHVFGVKMGRYSGPLKLIYSYRDFFSNIPETNLVTLGVSASAIFILAVVKEHINNNPKIKPKLKMPVPIELIMVVLGTVTSHFLKLGEKHNVVIVGKIPTGIPAPTPPPFNYLADVVTDAIAISIVAFAINVSMCKMLARKHDYDINPNQELIAYGFCNVFSSFFSAFCSAVSLSRSLVQENVGCKTQVTGLFSSVLILIVLLVVGPLFRTLPNCVLASIIIVALKGMFRQFTELHRLWWISKIDFGVWLVSFLGTVILDVDYGLAVGVIFSLLTVLARSSRPYSCLLGQLPNTDIYRDVSVYPSAVQINGVKIFRFEASLYFANAENFKHRIYEMTAVNPRKLKTKIQNIKKEDSANDTGNSNYNIDLTTVIIDASSWSYIDTVGVKTISQVFTEYERIGVKVLLAQCKSAIREMFVKGHLYESVTENSLFVTVHDAVLSVIQPNSQAHSLEPGSKESVTKASTSRLDADVECIQMNNMNTHERL